MKAFFGLVKAQFVLLRRDRLTFFFTLFFPLLFVVVFGFIWGGGADPGGPGTTRLGLVVEGPADRTVLDRVLARTAGLRGEDYATRAELEQALVQRKLEAGLVWDGATLLFVLDPGRVQENYALEALARSLAVEFNLERQGLFPVVGVRRQHVGGEVITGWFNMIIPGVMAFSLFSAGLYAVAGRIAYMKERRLLDRMLVTPMRPWALLVSIALARLALSFASTLMTLGLAVAMFRVQFVIQWPLYVLLVIVGTLGAMALGTVIALFVHRPGSASAVASILAQVMLFLSGVYIPVELMPKFLRTLSRVFPLTYLVEGMRYVTGLVDMRAWSFAAIVAGFAGLAMVLFPVLGRYVVTPSRR